jgi:hypothetical protein
MTNNSLQQGIAGLTAKYKTLSQSPTGDCSRYLERRVQWRIRLDSQEDF